MTWHGGQCDNTACELRKMAALFKMFDYYYYYYYY